MAKWEDRIDRVNQLSGRLRGVMNRAEGSLTVEIFGEPTRYQLAEVINDAGGIHTLGPSMSGAEFDRMLRTLGDLLHSQEQRETVNA